MKKLNLQEQVSRIRSMMGVNENVDSAQQEFDSALASAGIVLTPEEKSEINPDCPVEKPAEHSDVMGQLETAISNINDKGQLKGLLKQVLSMRKRAKQPQPATSSIAAPQDMNEQAVPVIVAGVSVPPVALTIALGFVALLIVIKLYKLIFGGGNRERQSSDCRKKHRLVRRFGISGVVNEEDGVESETGRYGQEKKYPDWHGSPYDRGTADSYYGRGRNPHYYPEGTYNGQEVTDLTPEELEAYNAGYDDNESSGDKKDWGE